MTQLDNILYIFNGIENRIQFTYELEENSSIPFLDMIVHRNIMDDHGQFHTNWYMKPIASGRLLNFNSIHPLNQRIGTAVGLINRILSLSDNKYYQSNVKVINELLRRNDYPIKLTNRLINKYTQRNNISDATREVSSNLEPSVKKFHEYQKCLKKELRKKRQILFWG